VLDIASTMPSLVKEDSEDRIDKRGNNRALGEHQKRAHQNDRDNQRRKPVFLTDFEKIPDIFEEIE